MELNRRQNTYYFVIIFAMSFILSLGSWWLYLIFKLSRKLETIDLPAIDGNLINMVKWEGLTFISLLAILSLTLVYLYIQDSRKAKTLQVFYSSLTHELKTPLASMRLQAQVIEEEIQATELPQKTSDKMYKYIQRLVEDNHRLENQLDNHLQLSRIEHGANLNIRAINLYDFLQNTSKQFLPQINLKLDVPNTINLKADDYALRTIFINLFKNSIEHSKAQDITVNIQWDKINKVLSYFDNGESFKGDVSKLGELFYKSNSPNGSGIGIYLIRELTKSMSGSFFIEQKDNQLYFRLKLKVISDE